MSNVFDTYDYTPNEDFPLRPLWDTEMYNYLRDIAEREWAEEFSEGLERLQEIGVLTTDDDERNITLTEIRRLLSLLGTS